MLRGPPWAPLPLAMPRLAAGLPGAFTRGMSTVARRRGPPSLVFLPGLE